MRIAEAGRPLTISLSSPMVASATKQMQRSKIPLHSFLFTTNTTFKIVRPFSVNIHVLCIP